MYRKRSSREKKDTVSSHRSRLLQAKLLAIILLTVGIFTAIFLLYSIKETRRVVREQSDAYGTSLVRGIASACSEALHENNFEALKKVIEMIAKSYGNINAIEIYVADMLVTKYSSIDPNSTGNFAKMVSERGTVYQAPVRMSIQEHDIELGFVRVILSRDKFYNLYIQQIHSSLYSAIILLLEISVLLYVLLNGLIVRPISVIEEGAKIIGAGNLEHHIVVKNNDEIGMLADAFNIMTRKLKTSKEKIELWNRTLEEKVQERTAELELANSKLHAAQYQLMQSSKMAAIGLIGASVAHELNNPLGGIIGYVQFMMNKIRQPAYDYNDFKACEKYLGYLEKESMRCKDIVSDLLSYSRKEKPEFEPVNIKEILQMSLAIMEYQLTSRAIKTIVTASEAESITVNGSANRIEQIFINLIANASQAMPQGGELRISVRAEQHKGQDMVILGFADTGSGIPKENIDKIFKSFFSMREHEGNIGLGLSISNQIVKEHNGKIEVTSDIGVGTTFTVFLPLCRY
ncbi:MAG: HAMP domain-containing protein [Candidatus Omnitrophica bacterium]|nr:HAMP domain-containing protein [Candidatus Omnitrophota bacterium]